MNENPSDWHLLHMLQDYIDKLPYRPQELYGISRCTRTVVNMMNSTGVYLMSDGKKSKPFGVRHCHSAWGCPVCEPYRMSKKAADISVALEALKQKNQKAIMITFTVPHHSNLYSCEQTSQILKNTWNAFSKRGIKSLEYNDKTTLKNGKVVRYKSTRHDALLEFRRYFNSKFHARAYEYTWGINGWHPHIHAIFWVDANKFNEVLDWEVKLLQAWRKIAQRESIKVLTEAYPNSNIEENINEKFNCNWLRDIHVNNQGLYISQKDGKPIEQQASMYICGWGADKEITSNYQRKASNKGHYTPYEMLLEAEKYPPNSKKHAEWLDRYLEFVVTAKKVFPCRVHYGFKKEFHAIIRRYKQSNAYYEYLKKKASNLKEQPQAWYLVYWFSKEQWLSLSEQHLIPYIISIAHLPMAKQIINQTLEEYDIQLTSFYEYGPLLSSYSTLLQLFNHNEFQNQQLAS